MNKEKYQEVGDREDIEIDVITIMHYLKKKKRFIVSRFSTAHIEQKDDGNEFQNSLTIPANI